MIQNYFRIALRYLRRNKLYALVNITGLAIGITSCILIGLYIYDEVNYDRFHKNADRLARVTWEFNFGDHLNKVATTGTRVGPELKRNFPEVESYVRTMKIPRVLSYREKLFNEKSFLYADSAFFGIFSFPLIKGDPSRVLDAPDKLVITETAAKKYFGAEDPIGQTLKVGVKDFQVSGIAKDVPGNSQIVFEMVGSFSSLDASKIEKWTEANYITYLLLHSKNQFSAVQEKIRTYCNTVVKREMDIQGAAYSIYHLEPMKEVHLYSSLDGFEPNGNILYIYILGAVAILILLIACVNYTNLSTAQSTGRSIEVGVRKVMGAGRKQVFYQFISESFFTVLLSFILGFVLALLLLPYFNHLAGKNLSVFSFFNPKLLMLMAALGLIITFAAGAYPSLILANGKITNILKSGLRLTGSNSLRKSLIVFQFVISVFLIISTVIIIQQLNYIRDKELGYDKEQVVVLPVDFTMLERYDDLKTALAAHSAIKTIGGAYEDPVHVGWEDGLSKGSEWTDANKITINAMPVDEDFVKALELKIIAGTDFNKTDVLQFDTSNGGKNLHHTYMLNETAAKAFGWTPEEAIGKMVTKNTSGPVKAVVKDFHFRSLKESIRPMVLFLDRRMVGSLFIKLNGDIPSAISHLEKTWKDRVKHRPFDYHFLDEDYNALYKTEERAASVFSSFAAIAVILACLGLFALTAYTMVQRTKEIGIRKILGATLADLLALVSKDFLKLVLIAFVIAIPVSWFAADRWLQTFVYRIPIQWWVFIMAGLVILVIAFITITMQAIRTAVNNPVKNLRTE